MARKKEYNEQEVIKKAMTLFWRNGYETTSVRMLEKEMGINQFSIYSSFGNKHGVFVESIKCYKKEIKIITDKLVQSQNGIEGIKQYFYDFLDFSKEPNHRKGCLIANTISELCEKSDPAIMEQLLKFCDYIKSLFADNLKQNKEKSVEIIEKQANYLMTSMLGLSLSSKIFDEEQLIDYIEIAFRNL